MVLFNGIQPTLPAWARDMLDDPERSLDEAFVAGLLCPIPSRIHCVSSYAYAAYPEQPPEELNALLLNDPAGFIRVWLSAYRNRRPSALRNIDLWDVTRALSSLAHSAHEFIDSSFATGERHTCVSEPWSRLVEAGLCSLCLETISSEGFFDEFSVRPPDLIHSERY